MKKFTRDDLAKLSDIVDTLEGATVDDAVTILRDLGETEGVIIGSMCLRPEELLGLHPPEKLASQVKNVTFEGGPFRNTWYTLTLQEVLEDRVLSNCLDFCIDDVMLVLGAKA